MGGSNKKDNLVRVPARVHFLLHWMLYRIYKTQEMAFAWHSFHTNPYGHRHYSKSYSYAKIAAGKATTTMLTGKRHSEETKKKMSISALARVYTDEERQSISVKLKARPFSSETREKMSLAKKGKPGPLHSEETKRKISSSNTGGAGNFSGKLHSEETKYKQKLAALSAPIGTCPHCNKNGKLDRIKPYHFDKCKLRPRATPADL